MQRIIQTSSNPGDLVLDPFCGSASTLITAESLKRRWVGIDMEPESVVLLEERLRDALNMEGVHVHRQDIPERTDDQPGNALINANDFLYDMQRGRCNGCQRAIPKDLLELDVVQPRRQVSRDAYANLQLLCRTCNVKKGTGTMTQLLRGLEVD